MKDNLEFSRHLREHSWLEKMYALAKGWSAVMLWVALTSLLHWRDGVWAHGQNFAQCHLGANSTLQGVELWSPKDVQVLSHHTYECNLIWEKDLYRCNLRESSGWVKDVEVRSSWINWVELKFINRCPYKTRRRHIQRRRNPGGRPWEDGSRGWSYAATSQRMWIVLIAIRS